MSEVTPSRDVPHLEMIEAMTRCAFELGKVATEIAKRAGDTKAFLAASAEFRHCFFSVRMGIRLAQALRSGLSLARPAPAIEPIDRERPEAADPLERERPDALEYEREREGDYEPVSLPQFLKTLRGVAARAEQRRDELPAQIRETTLPTLQGLLAQAAPPRDDRPRRDAAAVGVAVLARPPAAPASRSRLLASTGAVHAPLLRRRDSS